MNSVLASVSDMTVTVKSRELQRALHAEMQGKIQAAKRHFLAAAHLELVLAEDYEQCGNRAGQLRSIMSSASCFWRAGDSSRALDLLDEFRAANPDAATEIQELISEFQSRS